MALSPKSNSAHLALDQALEDVETGRCGDVPDTIKIHSTIYKYPHDYPNHFVNQQYLPDNLINKNQELNERIATFEKKNENLLRENEKLKNEKNLLRSRGYNKNNDSKYISHISGTGTRKFDYGGNYKNAMFKVLDNYSDDKSETSDKSSKTLSKKEEDKKK